MACVGNVCVSVVLRVVASIGVKQMSFSTRLKVPSNTTLYHFVSCCVKIFVCIQ